jgi:CheY-like chemotaxis protein
MKVLIIDDEDDIRSVAALSLGILGGLDVVEADSGSDGVSKAAVEKPDVILLDMMMPGMDGPATLAALKSNNDTKDIPVIFLTARAMNNEVERLRQMGARGILTKPFDPTSLATQVRSILDTTDKDCNSVAIDKDKKGIPL